jgi:hypothetical protein
MKYITLFIILSCFISQSKGQVSEDCKQYQPLDQEFYFDYLTATLNKWDNYEKFKSLMNDCVVNKALNYKSKWNMFINKKGTIIKIEPSKKLNKSSKCDAEIISLLLSLPNFETPIVDSEKVCTTYMFTWTLH